ncbi:MAG: hypothetical protein V3U39_04050 [Acidimicrobiia bacterium]
MTSTGTRNLWPFESTDGGGLRCVLRRRPARPRAGPGSQTGQSRAVQVLRKSRP